MLDFARDWRGNVRVVMDEPVPCVNPLRCSADLDLATHPCEFDFDFEWGGFRG